MTIVAGYQVSLSVTKRWRKDTIRLAETNTKERESNENIQTLNYAYMQHLEIIFGTYGELHKFIIH